MRAQLDTDFFSLPLPHAFAHRGASGDFPENTTPSFQAAAEVGAQYFELDVHMTRDGEIVVHHDEDLGRTCGVPRLIREMSWADVARADAGHNFAPDGSSDTPFRGKGVRVPKLSEILDTFPSTRILIEIKQAAPSLVQPLLDLISRAKRRRMVAIASELQEPINEIRALAPDLPTNLPYMEVAEFLQALAARDDAYRPRGDALQIPPEYEGWKLATPETIAFAHQLGLEFDVWTVNEAAEMHALLDAGVDGIISNYPARLLEVIRARKRG